MLVFLQGLKLSNGKITPPLVLPWPWETPMMVELGWTGEGYELRCVYTRDPAQAASGSSVAGVDLGEVHVGVVHDGQTTRIFNGRALRARRQYQNKLKARLAARQSRMRKGSRRWRRLHRSKRRQLRKLDHQIRDILHKGTIPSRDGRSPYTQQTTAMVSTLHASGVQTVAIGDVRDLRKRVDYGPAANQRIHQMASGRVREMITYKAERLGMQVVLQDEAYTSQECPCCGRRNKPHSRTYTCSGCGFRFHRDGVGAINIRRKYLGQSPVVGVMASPTGVRWHPLGGARSAYRLCR